ncbi:uncharacterized protein BYT42DRAFT_345910 [Radiomyces spectabilis]|uniref:uncharacterized protein n=1 Tax=Radiomyces spectabilis TaxID=64574 RepID=UPI00221FA750|nr:uncharacterized protein BYT42DRAFT_345910 [Radiomyces spectabilis]KAI8377481.1 hypothetical protein BYT42DRAFT_345910 [Radiomyces spectabilis]
MDTKLALRMEVLADNTLSVVFERNRLKELKLNYDKYETNIQNNMTQLREGLGVLEQQLSTAEESGEANTTEDEDKLIKLQIKVDKLDALMGEKDDQTAREVLLGNARKPARFAAVDVDPEDLEDGQILQLQQRIMDGKHQRIASLFTGVMGMLAQLLRLELVVLGF